VLDAAVARGRHAARDLVADDHHARIVERGEQLRRGVGRAVVDDDHLDEDVFLAQRAAQRGREQVGAVVCRDHDAHLGIAHHAWSLR